MGGNLMRSKTLCVPEDALVNMLKALPRDVLVDVFWKTVVEGDIYPLTTEEKELICKKKSERQKRRNH